MRVSASGASGSGRPVERPRAGAQVLYTSELNWHRLQKKQSLSYSWRHSIHSQKLSKVIFENLKRLDFQRAMKI